jgi:cytochrome P450
MIRFPPGPKRGFPGSALLRFRKDPLAYFEKMAREFGDVAHMRLGREDIVFVNHPEFIRDIFVTNCNNFTKGRAFFRAGGLLGRGLLTSEGEFHRRQRRMIQPAFHARRVAAFAEVMTKHAKRLRSRWHHEATLDASREMMRLTLAVVAETFFGADLESDTSEIGSTLAATMDTLSMKMFPVGELVARLPLPGIRKVQAGRTKLDEILYRLIDERRRSAQKHDDLLQMLLEAQDEQDSTARMTDKQVRDEAITMLLAGQLTTANTLSWTWYLLSQHLEVEGRLHEEVDRVLDSRLPVVADLKSLSYTESTIAEALRLYPPQWMMTRRVLNDYEVGQYVAPAGSLVVVSPYVMHRDARYFAEPHCFQPHRWTAEFRAQLPKYAYFPFGGGPRGCIGEGFAWTELVLVVATLAQQWKLRLRNGHRVIPQPLVTLRPKHGKAGLCMTALQR